MTMSKTENKIISISYDESLQHINVLASLNGSRVAASIDPAAVSVLGSTLHAEVSDTGTVATITSSPPDYVGQLRWVLSLGGYKAEFFGYTLRHDKDSFLIQHDYSKVASAEGVANPRQLAEAALLDLLQGVLGEYVVRQPNPF